MRLSRLSFAAAAPLALLSACNGAPADDTASPAADAAQPAASPMAATSPSASAASVIEPPVAFLQCRSCHAVEPGKNGIGPTLAGIMGSKAGEVPGYNFSAPLKASGIVWTRETLDQWLQGPMKMVPGTRMVIGVPNPEARKAIIDYLETVK